MRQRGGEDEGAGKVDEKAPDRRRAQQDGYRSTHKTSLGIRHIPPEHPTALPKVISRTSILPLPRLCPSSPHPPSSPRACPIPLPWRPYTPVECASSKTTHCRLRGIYSSIASKIAGKGAMSPSIEYRLSRARNTTSFRSLAPGSFDIWRRTRRKDAGSLCLNARRRCVGTRDARIPEWTEA